MALAPNRTASSNGAPALTSARRSHWRRLLWTVGLLACVTQVGWGPASAGQISLLDPGRVSPGVVVSITGTGFNATASANDVVFESAAGVARVTAASVTTVSATRGLRRLLVRVPSMPDGPASVRVVNTATQEQSNTPTLQVFSLTPDVAAIAAGETREVVINATAEARFVAGSTRVAAGQGVAVGAVVVESPTRLRVPLTAAANAAVGPRTLEVLAPGVSGATSFAVTPATEPNTAPTVNAGADQTITLPAAAVLAGTVSDDGKPAGNTLTVAWSQVSGPGTTTFATPTSASTSATFSVAGTYVLRLTANDGALTASDDVTVTVNPATEPNTAPTVNAGADQTITLPAAAVLAGTVTDDGKPVGNTLTVAWSQVSGPGTTTFATPTSASTSATFSVAGTYVLRLTANDGALTASDDVTVTVNPATEPNTAPTVNAGADQTITLPAAAVLAGTVSDDGKPAGNTLTVAWSQVSGPGTTTFATPTSASTSATFSIAGTYVLRLTANDGALSASDDVTVTVNPATEPNTAPTVNAGADQTITLPAAAVLAGAVSDDGKPAGNTLTVAWSQVSGPGTTTFATPTSASTSATFSVAGTYVLRLTGNDGALSASDDVTVTVNPATEPNTAPTVNAGADQTITLPAAAVLAGTVSDDGKPAGNTLTVAWSQVSGPGTTTFATPTSASTSATFSVAGTYVLRLTANDGALSASDDVTVTVNDGQTGGEITNRAPTADAGSDLLVTQPALATLVGRVADDGYPVGSTLVMQWSQVSGPGNAEFTAPALASTAVRFPLAGVYRFRLSVSDGVLDASDDVLVTVRPAPEPPNVAPTADAGPDVTVTLPAAIALSGTASDDGRPAGSVLITSWSQRSGPGALVIVDAAARQTQAIASLPGTYVLRFVADDGALTGSDEVTVTVLPAAGPTNAPPTIELTAASTVTLPATLSLSARVSDDGLPAGAQVTTTWQQVSGPGQVTFTTPTGLVNQAAFAVAGTYRLAATASDGDQSRTAEVVVTVSPAGATNTAPRVTAGADVTTRVGVPVALDGRVEDDDLPSGGARSQAWSKVRGPGMVSFAAASSATTSATFGLPGRYVLELSATDSELVGADMLTVDVAPAAGADLLPPVITLVAPTRALPGQVVRVLAEVADDVGIADVTFAVDGTARPADTEAPYEISLTLPEVVAPGQRVTVRATARDTSGRIGSDARSIDIALTPDTQAPTLDLRVPTSTSAGATLNALAIATDDVGVDRVEFFLDDVPVAPDTAAPFTAEWEVPAGASGSVTVRAEAVDAAGNRTSVTRAVPVTALADETAPSITLTAVPEAAAGAAVPLLATVDDPQARVRFLVQGALLREVASEPYTATLVMPDLPVGTVLTVRAEARDLAGNTGVATREVQIIARPIDTAGILSGQVIDDVTGLPLGGARVRLLAVPSGLVSREVFTDEVGYFAVDAAAGPALVVIDMDGYTSAAREAVVVAERVAAIVDARLTRRRPSQAVGASATRLDAGLVQVDLPAGAIAGGALSLTAISAQGVPALLPAGWTPVVAFDLAPAPASFALPVLARATVPTLPTGRALALVRWEAGTAGWRVVEAAVAIAGTTVEQTLPGTGLYALVIADASPAVPPTPVAGAWLDGVTRAESTDTDAGLVTPDPRVLFAAPDARSVVTATVTTAAPTSSGLRVQSQLRERYDFFDGAAWQPDARTQDVTLFQSFAGASTLEGRFPVGPSRAFEAVALQRGVITVELRTPVAPVGSVVGGNGGVVVAPDDELVKLGIGVRVFETPSIVGVQRIAVADLGADLPTGVSVLDAFAITVPGPLATPATLSLPRPAGFVDASRLVLARLLDVGGRTRLVLAALVVTDGQGLKVTQAVGAQPTLLPGIHESGTYVLVQASSALGYVAGRVVDGAGQGVVGALVTPGTFPVVSLSTAAGAYFSAAPAGGLVLTGADTTGDRRGERPVVIAAGVITPATLALAAVPPQVTSTSPGANATDVLLDDPLVVTFSKPLDPSSVAGAVRLAVGEVDVPVTVALSRGDTVIEVRPAAPLVGATRHVLTLAASITDRAGIGLAQPFSLSFQTIDRVQPETPPAGTITASVPDRSGNVTVRGSQGTATPGYQVFVENLTRRTAQVALVNADGSFAAGLRASITDALRVRIVDPSGNATTVEIATLRQVNPDGSVSQVVTDAGGVVEGPEGTRAVVKPGTFPDGATVTMKALPTSAFPRQLSPAEQQNFSLEKAISLDFDGATPQQYVDVSWPASPNDKATDQWVLTESVFVNGEWAMNVVDTVKYRDGRLTTASPPCPGVTAAAVYGLLKSSVAYGLNYAQMYADGRYKLKMSMEIFGGSPIAIPYAAFSTELPKSICFPAFVGRMSISPNSTRITVSGTDLRPTDTAIEVASDRRPTPLRFERKVPPFHLRVFGFKDDSFVVYAVGPESPSGTRVRSTRYNQPNAFVDLGDVDKQVIDFVFEIAGITQTGTVEPVTLVVDPADVGMPVSAFKVVALRSNKSTTVPVRDQLMTVNVPGGGDGETFTVEAITPLSLGREEKRIVPFLPFQAVGPGNLVLRASPGTIDPTREEMGSVSGPARTKFTLASDIPGFVPIVIPPERIVRGGLDFAFDGIEGAKYTVITEYDTRPPFALELPTVRYVLRNVNTNQVLKTIFGQAPPRDEPVELPALTDDTVPPSLLAAPTRMDTFDPAGLLTFRFSESMKPETLRKAIVVRDGTLVVKGHVRISDQNRVATFVPDVPLELDNRYTVEVIGGPQGATDLAGNPFDRTVSFQVTTFTPRSIGVTTGGDPALIFKDTAWLFRDDGTTRRRHLFTVLGSQVDNVRWFDGTDPATLVPRGRVSSAPSLQRIAAIETDKVSALGEGKQMLVATTMFDTTRSALTFFRATEPGQLSEVGSLPLTKNVSTFNPLDTTVRGIGYARNVVLHETSEGVRAIVAVEKYGVMSADVGTNINGLLSRTENAYPMNGVVDIAGYGEGVVAVGTTPERNTGLVQLGASLDVVGSVGLPGVPRSVSIGRNVAIDVDRDGEVTPDERGDVAVVGTFTGLQIVRLAGPDGNGMPTALFSIPLDGVVKQIEVDEERSRVIALVDESVGPYLHIVDLARGDIDPPSNGLDPRIIFRRQFPAGANGMRLDKQAGLLYIPTPTGLDTWLIADRCCDLGVELTADLDKKAKSIVSGNLGDVLTKELAAIKRGVVLGLRRAEERCEGFDVSKMKLIESGSSACLWADNPVRACGSNYQPLVSDHDISTFMPDDWYSRQVDDPNWDGEGTAEKVLLAGCVVAALSYPFTDPFTDEPKPVGESGLVFKDISFIPNFAADFDSMEYRLERTIEGLPGDVDNDLAMGRQLLVMKHLTEAYGVDLRGTEGYKQAYAAVMVDEADFETRFERFRTVTRIPEVEGYEWGVLMQFMLAKAKAYVRFKGSGDERSAFNDLFVKQFHTAAKAGIRAAAARIVADTPSRDLFLGVTREDESSGLRVFRKNACLLYQPKTHPTSWPAKPCGSMEEYVAATAVRTLETNSPIFTLSQVMDIVQFYRVKADEQPIATEAEADRFIAKVHNFVMHVKQVTYPVYEAQVASDRRGAERLANREYAEGVRVGPPPTVPGGRIATFLKDTKFTVKPKVYNRGFMSAPNVYLRAYIANQGQAPALACVGEPVEGEDPDPALVDRCRLALNLNGGALIFPSYRHRITGAYMPTATSQSIDAFPLKVDQGKTGTNGYIVFTLDLPERSANEADRTNNVGGVQYYILDPSTGTAPPLPAEPPSPVDPALLAPDPYCLKSPQLTLTQSVVLDQKEKFSPVQAYLGAKYELNIKVTNTGSTLVENVLVCTSLDTSCPSVGNIGPGATVVRKVPLTMPSTPINLESVATAESPRLGISTASLLRIGAKCEPLVLPLDPDPNPALSTVMLGGRAVRHYMVVNPVTGDPASGVSLVFRGSNGTAIPDFFHVSGSDGLVDTRLGASSEARVIDGLAVPTGRLLVTESWGLVTVNGLTPECGKDFAFNVQATKPFEFTQSIEAGGAIRTGFKVFEKGPSGEADFGGSLKIEFTGKGGTDRSASQATTITPAFTDLEKLTWERKAQVGLQGSASYPGFSAKGEFTKGLLGDAKGLKVKATATAAATQTYRYQFDGKIANWSPEKRSAFTSLLFPTLAESEASTLRGIVAQLNSDEVNQVFLQVFGDAEPYRTYRTNRIGSLSLVGTAEATGFDGTIDFVEKPAADAPKDKENKSAPLFAGKAGGNATVAVGYEKDEQVSSLGTTPLDDDKVLGLVHTIDIDGKYDWKSSYTTSFNKAEAEIRSGNMPDEAKDKAVELLKWAEGRLTNSATGKFDGGLRFRVFARPVLGGTSPSYRVYKLEVGFRTTKLFGFTEVGAPPVSGKGTDYRINFVIEGDGQAERILDQAIGRGAVFVQLLSDAQKQRTTEFLNSLGSGDVRDLLTERPSVFTADELYDQLVGFVRSLFDASGTVGAPSPAQTSFYEEARHVEGQQTDLGVNESNAAKVTLFKIDPLRVEAVATHVTARGIVMAGGGYLLEDYSHISVAPPKPKELFLDLAGAYLDSYITGLGGFVKQGLVETINGWTKGSTSVTPSAPSDKSKIDLGSWSLSLDAAPSTPTAYRGQPGRAFAGKPRYGIGDFVSLVATDTLSGPVTLTLSYASSAVADLDESSLRMYRWSNAQQDWVLVPTASIDTNANRATVTTSEMGLYTLGARMPAGPLQWSVVAWNASGTGTTVTLQANGLRMNDGTPLPPGLIVHVQLPDIEDATFSSPDASAAAGHQAVADADGRVTVTFTVPGALTAVDVRGFSDLGNAYGQAKVVRP